MPILASSLTMVVSPCAGHSPDQTEALAHDALLHSSLLDLKRRPQHSITVQSMRPRPAKKVVFTKSIQVSRSLAASVLSLSYLATPT